MPNFRNRRICWTLHTDGDAEVYLDNLPKEQLRYVVFGVELCPTSGRRHFQGYAQFRLALRLRSIKAIFGNSVHVEVQNARDDKDAIEYCKKDGVFYEWGTPAEQGKSREADVLMEIVKSGGGMRDVLKEATGHGWCQYNKGLERAMRLTIPPRSPDSPPTVRILWGAPGVGKSLSAYQAGAAKLKWRDPFCIGYNGQRKVVFDDFNPGQMTRTDFLNITDRYPLQVEVKGDSIEWSPEEIWFTSNFDPEYWKFKDGEEWDGACARRVTIEYKQ